MKPNFGDKVTITNKLRRNYNRLLNNSAHKVFWEEVSLPKVTEAVYIGHRRLSNGTTFYDREEGNSYRAEDYFKAALVVLSERTNPIYVPWYQVETPDAST